MASGANAAWCQRSFRPSVAGGSRWCRNAYQRCSAAPSSAYPSAVHTSRRGRSTSSRPSQTVWLTRSPAAVMAAATERGGAMRHTPRLCSRRVKKTCRMPAMVSSSCGRWSSAAGRVVRRREVREQGGKQRANSDMFYSCPPP
eukprot:scaffold6821_cov66-Phaeocystis_antarctica.AAC.5